MINFNSFIYSNNSSNFNINTFQNFNFSFTNISLNNNLDLANINFNNYNNLNSLLIGSNLGFLFGSILGGLLGSTLANQNNFYNLNPNLSNTSINNTLLLTLLLLLLTLMINNRNGFNNGLPNIGGFPSGFPNIGGFPNFSTFPNIGSFPNFSSFPNIGGFPGGLGFPNENPINPMGAANPIKGNGSAQDFVRIALSQVGKQYIFGAEANPNDSNPKAFDCSELVEWAVKRAGGNIPDGADNQFNYCRQHGTVISVQQALNTPGALLFYGDLGHVMISLGDGRVVEAGNSRVGVVVRPASVHGDRIKYGALVPGLKY
jgi:hypothetical protein